MLQKITIWLLGLEPARMQDAHHMSWQFLEPIDAWLWFVVVIVAVGYVTIIYRRDSGTRAGKCVMAGLRAFAIIWVVILLCKPVVVYQRDRHEPSLVAFLLDESASMNHEDQYGDDFWKRLAFKLPNDTPRILTRWHLLRMLLGQNDGQLVRDLLDHHDVHLFRFAGSVSGGSTIRQEGGFSQFRDELTGIEPLGNATHLASAVEHVLQTSIDSHLTALVIISDGQATRQENWDALIEQCKRRGVSIYALPVGSPDPPKDVSILTARVDPYVYQGDRAQVLCHLRFDGVVDSPPIQLLLRDEHDDSIVAQEELRLEPDENERTVELQFLASRAGPAQLRLEIPPLPEETQVQNNFYALDVTVVEDQVRVLYVEGYPRYEYRYLKNTLLREESIVSSVLLLSADPEFVQEGTEPIRRFPETIEELATYDVVLLGDVPSGSWLTTDQLSLLETFVLDHGGGLALIAGAYHTPRRFSGTILERMLPVVLTDATDQDLGTFNQKFRPRLTASGMDSPIFRLWQKQQSASEVMDRLPGWYWYYPVQRIKPAAEVLLQHQEAPEMHAEPLVVVGRYGKGAVLYQGSDDSWRWRRHQGEAIFDTYWVQVVRFLARNKKFEAPAQFALRIQPATLEPNEELRIMLEVLDPALESQLPDEITVDIHDARGIRTGEATLSRLPTSSRRFAGIHLPAASGQYEVVWTAESYAIAGSSERERFDVMTQTAEYRRPEANPALLSHLAEETGGAILEPWQWSELNDRIPLRRYVVPDDLTEPIWDSVLALILFVVPVFLEWILRKKYNLT